jgi:hypothetical protein
VYEALRQLWSAFLPETQKFVEDLLTQHGETWARRAIALITTERDQAQQVSLIEDERAALQQQWAELQPFTRNILEGLLTSHHDTLSLFNLILLAIGEERTHAMCNSELEQRAAYLEITLAEYRKVVDLEGREKIEQQFMVVGELLGFRALPSRRLGQRDLIGPAPIVLPSLNPLAEVVRDGKEILAEEAAASVRAQEKSRLRQVEQQLAVEQQRIAELEQQLAVERSAALSAESELERDHQQLGAMLLEEGRRLWGMARIGSCDSHMNLYCRFYRL